MIIRQNTIKQREDSAKKARRFVRGEARFAADRLANMSLSSTSPSLRDKATRALAALSQIARGDLDAGRVAITTTALEAISGGANS